MNLVHKPWPWPHPLQKRTSTQYIVIHHTAGPQDQDTQQIWDEHINIGDNGIAYHFIVKGDGTIVVGRSIDTIGAHAHGVNQVSVGVVLEGNFMPGKDKPTTAQVEALKELLPYIRSIYTGTRTIGHRDVPGISGDPGDATACPGDVLYAMLKELAA